MSFKVIIIDDESLAIEELKEQLKAFPRLEIAETCSNGFEGIKAVSKHNPDLIFLDIRMPKINGFEMLELIDNPPKVIFTTAYDEYALKAFEANALDYLLKPYSEERLNKAVNRFLEAEPEQGVKTDYSEIDFPVEGQHRIVVKSGNDIKIIPAEEIIYIESYDDYVKVNVAGDCYLKKFTMQKAEKLLDSSKFVRVHRSFILNIDFITRLERLGKESFIAILKDDTRIPLSKAGYPKLRSVLGV